MRQPILLTKTDGNSCLVQYEDVVGYEPYPQSCTLIFRDRSKISVSNRMCCSASSKENHEFVRPNMEKGAPALPSIRKLLKESERGRNSRKSKESLSICF